MKSKHQAGWLRTWYSELVKARRRKPREKLCKLRCEMLERRELLSATVVLGSQAFKTITVASTNGTATETANNTTYDANANLTGTVDYSSATLGSFSGTLNGPITQPSGQGNFTATVAMTQDSSNPNNTQNLSGSATLTSPASLAGMVSTTGEFNTSTFTASITWSSGSWSGSISPTGTTSAYDIVPTAPQWDSAAETQIDFGFNVNGTWQAVPPSECGTALATVNAYWASGATMSTIIGGPIGGATVPVYWNQASGTASIQGITSIPAGANYVLIDVAGGPILSSGNISDNPVAFNVRTIGSEAIDNSQPGFWSSASGNWTTESDGLGGSSLVSSTANGSEQSQAAWWFSMPAGVYELSVTYTAAQNLTTDMGLDLYDGVGNWIGQVPVNEQVAPSSYSEYGVEWQNLGAFKLTSNVFHVSTWNSSANGAICVNGIQLQAAPVIDSADLPDSYTNYPPSTSVGSFTTSGSWATQGVGAFGSSDISTSTAGSGSSMATWTMPVTPGSYEIDVTWPSTSGLSANATYNIFDGSSNIGSVSVNQQMAPSGISFDGVTYQTLGAFTVSSTQLSVTLANSAADGQVEADTIRILPEYQPTPIVDQGLPGSFVSATGWTTQNTGLYGSSLVSNTANGSEQSQAAWWFPVQPGQYYVEVTWVSGGGLSSTTPFDVYNALTYISEPTVNEQTSPAGVTDQGVAWQSLGTFTMTSDVLHVSTWNSQANGAICVSGIRIVPVT
jgi:hypothetical protein